VLPLLSRLLRHGRSLANESGIIISKVQNGVKPEYKLAPLGREQALLAGEKLRDLLQARGEFGSEFAVYASPFSRTQETAQLACEGAGITCEIQVWLPT
jgi:broad specificity phosphatase PhoE